MARPHNPKPGPGRPKGSKNKVPNQLRQMIIDALDNAGGVEYLTRQAAENPGPFLALIGKVLPTTLTTGDEPFAVEIRRVIVDPASADAL